MVTQFKDNTFSAEKPFKEALRDFINFVDTGEAVSFHVGPDGIEQAKRNVNVRKELDGIKARLEDIELKDGQRRMSLYIPCHGEILKYGVPIDGRLKNKNRGVTG